MSFINSINNGTGLFCGLVKTEKFEDHFWSCGKVIRNLEVFAFEKKEDYFYKKSELSREGIEFVNITDSLLFHKLTKRYANYEGKFKITKDIENSSLEYLKSTI
jgi:hypothetical protein